MSKRTSYGKIYRPDVRGRRPNVRVRPCLPRGHVLTRGRVFTIRADGKKMRPCGCGVDAAWMWRGCAYASAQTQMCVFSQMHILPRVRAEGCVRADPSTSVRTQRGRLKKIFLFLFLFFG
jgi:hypothetical protein